MSDPVRPAGPPASGAVQAAIERGARAAGVDFSLLVETARRESALNPNARAATSSATGLFQFIDSTWLDMVRRHGADHGLGEQAQALANGADAQTRREILALRNDPEIAARMAGELTRENADILQRNLGRAPHAGELYAAHVMGAGGALKLIAAASEGASSAAAVFPREASANQGLFYEASGAPRSAQALLDKLKLTANAGIGDRAADAIPVEGEGFSPAMAQALFAMALLPLLRTSDAPEADPLRAIAAYRKAAI
jgi:hypothetical protein